MTKKVMKVTTPTSPLVIPGDIVLSDSEKSEALACSLEVQLHPVTDPSAIKTADVAFRAYSYAPGSKPILTNPEEVQDAIRGLKVSKAPGPDGIPNRAFKHLPQRVFALFPSNLRYFGST